MQELRWDQSEPPIPTIGNDAMRSATLVFLLLFTAFPVRAERYLCTPELTSTFAEDSSGWRQTDEIFLGKWYLREAPTNWWRHGHRWVVYNTTQKKLPVFGCNADFGDGDFLSCQFHVGTFNFDRKALRYVLALPGGYFGSPLKTDRDKTLAPARMEIGRCKDLDKD